MGFSFKGLICKECVNEMVEKWLPAHVQKEMYYEYPNLSTVGKVVDATLGNAMRVCDVINTAAAGAVIHVLTSDRCKHDKVVPPVHEQEI